MGAVMAEKVVAQQWRWRCSNGNGKAATAMGVQQRLRWRSNGDGGAAMAMAVQQRLRQCSNGNCNGGAAMGVAVVVEVQQWRRSMVEAAQQRWWKEAIVEYHRIISNSVFV